MACVLISCTGACEKRAGTVLRRERTNDDSITTPLMSTSLYCRAWGANSSPNHLLFFDAAHSSPNHLLFFDAVQSLTTSSATLTQSVASDLISGNFFRMIRMVLLR